MQKKVDRPMLGAAYYPETWDEAEQEKDIAMMVETGINVVRMGEFAWHRMEPHCGEFHFEWLHRVIDKLDKAGISVILGTPTAVTPMWLEELDPDMQMLDGYGKRPQHGGRRSICSNNPTYLKYAKRIAERMGQEFGADTRVIGWQIDNEIWVPQCEGCFCERCLCGWPKYLEDKYGSIDNLNEQWDTEIFSQAYDSFEQIPAPKPYSWHGPHIRHEWLLYQAQTHVDLIKMQTDVLHHYTEAPVGTDLTPFYSIDFDKMAECTDVMQFNHYNDENDLWQMVFWFDYMRSFKDIPFWTVETSTCWSGGTFTPPNYRAEGFCKANSWLPFVLGGSANLYWLWRQHRGERELMHGAVLYANGRPMHIWNEVKEIAAELKKAANFLMDTQVTTETAVLVTTNNVNMLNAQPIVDRDGETGDRILNFYRSLTNMGLRPDAITAKKGLERYKLLFTPYALSLEEGDLSERIEKWVKDGGVWVAGPMTDIRTGIGAHYTEAATGMLEKLTGSYLAQQIPDHRHMSGCEWADGSEYEACHFLQLFDAPDDAEVLATVKTGYSALIGKAVLFQKRIGKGLVIVIGALPGERDMKRLLEIAIRESGVAHFEFTGDIVASIRKGEKCCGIAAQEIGGKAGELKITGTMTDVLTGKVYTDTVDFAPYQTVILNR